MKPFILSFVIAVAFFGLISLIKDSKADDAATTRNKLEADAERIAIESAFLPICAKTETGATCAWPKFDNGIAQFESAK